MKEQKKIMNNDAILIELNYLKRLMVLLLLKAGSSQTEVALALGVDPSTVSRMFPASKVQRFDQKD